MYTTNESHFFSLPCVEIIFCGKYGFLRLRSKRWLFISWPMKISYCCTNENQPSGSRLESSISVFFFAICIIIIQIHCNWLDNQKWSQCNYKFKPIARPSHEPHSIKRLVWMDVFNEPWRLQLNEQQIKCYYKNYAALIDFYWGSMSVMDMSWGIFKEKIDFVLTCNRCSDVKRWSDVNHLEISHEERKKWNVKLEISSATLRIKWIRSEHRMKLTAMNIFALANCMAKTEFCLAVVLHKLAKVF